MKNASIYHFLSQKEQFLDQIALEISYISMHQIDNHKERCNPAENAELDEVIFHETFCRGTTEAEDDHILEIPQKTGQYPTAGEIDIAGAHSLDDLW